MPNKTYPVPRFTKAAQIFISNRHFSEEQWVNENIPENLFDFGHHTFSAMRDSGITLHNDDSILVCTIGDEFIDYIMDECNGEFTEESFVNYMKTITPQKAIELMREENMDLEQYLFGLPIVIDFSPNKFNDISFQKVLEKGPVCQKIGKILSERTKAGIVFPGTLVSETLMFAYDRYTWIKHILGEKGQFLERRSFAELSSEGENSVLVYLPFLAERKIPTAVIPAGVYSNPENLLIKTMDGFEDSTAAREIEAALEEIFDCNNVYIPAAPVYSYMCLEQSRKIKRKLAEVDGDGGPIVKVTPTGMLS